MLNYPINDTEFNENCFKIICKWTYKRLHKSCSIAEKMAHKGNLEKKGKGFEYVSSHTYHMLYWSVPLPPGGAGVVADSISIVRSGVVCFMEDDR